MDTQSPDFKHFKVFISSPGDVKEERKLAIDILNRLEDDAAFERKLHIDIVAWDKGGAQAPMFISMTPQEAINEELPMPSECDVMIVILWSRMGTPLPSTFKKEDGTPYRSGTEWEYYDALRGNNQHKKPKIILYRRMESVPFAPNDPDLDEKFKQYKAVNELFTSFTNADGSLNSGYTPYTNCTEFKDIFSHQIKTVLFGLVHSKPSALPVEAPPVETKPRIHHNLPSRIFNLYGSLLGREAELKRVMLTLESRYPFISIEGMPGVGKSSLALEVAYSCIRDPNAQIPQAITFDYIVWISAKDKPYQKYWLDDVLNMIARVMDFFAITQKPLTEDKLFDVNKLLQSQCTLLIVDNFETIEDPELERWLEQVPEPSKVIVTSQRRQFRMSMPIDLEGLSTKDSLDLIRRHAETFHIEFILHKSDDELLPLVKNTAGNPLAIVWSLGTLKGGTLSFDELIEDLRVNYKNKNISKIIDYLFSKSWKNLTTNAQKVLTAVPLFVGADSISKESLCATIGLSDDDFDAAVSQLIEFKLLQSEVDKQEKIRYKVHPLTHTFAGAKLKKRKKFEEQARDRWSTYFYDFIKKNIVRPTPAERYWNALVSDNMLVIDREWTSINEVLAWADREKRESLILDLIMLLVHYMDSRFMNLQRMYYVKKAVDIAEKKERKEDEALLRLDALGWTLVEEDNLEAAYEEIKRGFDIASHLDENSKNKSDLIALGYAWQARVKIEMNESKAASQLIDEAIKLEELCSSWIKSRVYMAAGDIALKQNRHEDALTFYERQKVSMEEYGDEGKGYQVKPRLGLAYVSSRDFEKAKEKFYSLKTNENIPIAKLYGDYGLALVAYKLNQKEQARILATETKEALSRKTASNILLKLINQLYQEMADES